jgi:hypothetical protein
MAARPTAGCRFSPELTYHAYHALDGHILGFTLWQLGHSAAALEIGGAQEFADLADKFLQEFRAAATRTSPSTSSSTSPHRATGERGEFEFGLGLILDGLKKARGTS